MNDSCSLGFIFTDNELQHQTFSFQVCQMHCSFCTIRRNVSHHC